MSHPFDDPACVCLVLANTRNEHSLWPESIAVPAGWTPMFGPAPRARCLERIAQLGSGGGAACWTEAEASVSPTLARRFEAEAIRRPKAIALRGDGQQLSYEQLNLRANRLAHRLIADGAAPGRFIAVALPRSLDLVIALLAVVKAGAAYLPIDPDYPAERIAFTLKDAQPACLITTRALLGTGLDPALPSLLLDAPETAVTLLAQRNDNPSDRDRAQLLRAEHPAYVIYTSGSTGTPKGVVIPHHNVLRLFSATAASFGFDERDVWTLFHSCAFDFSVWELWGALLHGGSLVIVPHAISRSPRDFLELLVRERVTVLNQTPSAFSQLAQADAALPALSTQLCLRTVIFGGEALDPARLSDWYRRHREDAPRLVNMYGITETTVHVTLRELRAEDAAVIGCSPIGAALPDLQLHVLDAALQPVAPGEIGELHVGGAGLASAYLNQPALTATRFIANPHGASGSRLYRSGDLARLRLDGEIDYIGRADHQVKLRGFRIELGEIETRLLRQPGVADAVASLQPATDGELRLVSHVVASRGQTLDLAALRQQLARELPTHMVPAVINRIDTLPLTANGKLDRSALPAAVFDLRPGPAPTTSLEIQLAQMFAEALGLERVGIDDNFFDLGGSSMQMVRLQAAIVTGLKIPLTIVELFSYPRVRALAQWLGTSSQVQPTRSETDVQDRARRQQALIARTRIATRPSGS